MFRAFPKTFIHRHSELGGHADGRREEDGSFGGLRSSVSVPSDIYIKSRSKGGETHDVSGSETSVDEHVVSSDVG